MSRLGKLPVSIPAGVKISIADNTIKVEGPKGTLTQTYDPSIEIKIEEEKVLFTRKEDTKQCKAYHGLYRNLLKNMVIGVSEGFSKTLIINGVGFRAEVQDNLLIMNLGYSNDVIVVIPEGLTVTAETATKILISGIRKDLVGEFAADVRKLRKPEPYKGKGIRYESEIIRRKVGKSGV